MAATIRVPSMTAFGIVFVGFSMIPEAVVAASTPINPQNARSDELLSDSKTEGYFPGVISKYSDFKKKKLTIGIIMSGVHFKIVRKTSQDPAKVELRILIDV